MWWSLDWSRCEGRRVVLRRGHVAYSIYYIYTGSVKVIVDTGHVEADGSPKTFFVPLRKGACFGVREVLYSLVFVSAFKSACQLVCLSVCPPTCLPAYLPTYLPTDLSIRLPIDRSIHHPYIHPSTHPFTHSLTHPPTHPSIPKSYLLNVT